ncbi:MAG: hypothetical protein IKC57_03040 [Alistipes sp.]|nr:hypothetical protein [Alistipes sp.]
MCKQMKRRVVDVLALVIGVVALLSNLLQSGLSSWNRAICIVAGVVGFLYFINVLLLFVAYRPKFDWYLINGNFLFKVVTFVVLVPSMITTGFLLFGELSGEEYRVERLIYEEDLCAEQSDKGDAAVEQMKPSIYWAVYFHFIDPGNQHMSASPSGRGWTALIAILGVFLLNGLLVSSIVGWVDNRKARWLSGETRYARFLRRESHYVIIGGNDMVEGLIKQKLLTKNRYILILTSRDVESFRRELFSTLSEEEEQRVIIYYGNRTSKADIESLCVESAEEVYILGEESRTDDIESYHDTMNMKTLTLLLESYRCSDKGERIAQLLPLVDEYRGKLSKVEHDKGRVAELQMENAELLSRWRASRELRLRCRVMFEYQTTFSVFQFYDVDESVDAYIDFEPFNYYEMWAQRVMINTEIEQQRVLANFRNNGYLPLEGASGIREGSKDYVHLFVVGMSRMGVAMAVEAAHLAHYPNYTEQNKIRTKITFIDDNAAQGREFFMGRFKELFDLSHWRYGAIDDRGELNWSKSYSPTEFDYLGGDFIDIEWEFIDGGVESAAIQRYMLEAANPNARVTVAICHAESTRAHASALYMQKQIYASDAVEQVLVYNRYGGSIIDAISASGDIYPYRGKLRCFGYAGNCFDVDVLERGERLGVKIGRLYDGDSPLSMPIYDNAGKSKAACAWSNTYNANTIWTKLRCVEYNPKSFKEDDALLATLARVEHNRWCVEQLLMNFRYLTREEQEFAIANNNSNKRELKHRMAHLNICSNERLAEIDAGAIHYDMAITRGLSDIYQEEMAERV